MRTWNLGAVLAVSCLSTAAHARLVELTFDDGEAGTGVATGHAVLANMEALRGVIGVAPATTRLVGNAVRGALDAGRYGRAAEFPDGGGYIEIKGLTGLGGAPTLYLWVQARDLASGTLLETVGVYKVLLDHGTLFLEATRPDGQQPARLPFGPFPADGAFHHVTIFFDPHRPTPFFSVAIDRTPLGNVSTALVGVTASPELRLGEGFTGSIDELLLNSVGPGPEDLFDRSPDNCPPGLTCREEVLTMKPAGFPHEVPVRFKSAWDAVRCTPSSPCPLLFDISGGTDCSDDYQTPVSVAKFADAGFFVVTPDVYCEASSKTSPYPTETSQYIAVKEHLIKTSPLKALIQGTAYAATGCSHGAGSVTVWALHETDHPSRTYARSPGLDALCVLAGGVACSKVTERNEQRIIDELGSLDWNHPQLEAMHHRGASADQITAAIAQSQDLAISFGVNQDGPVCNADGTPSCSEEGLWGMNWGARRFRDVWRLREPAGAPTGYFVEDQGADCRHCADENSQAFKCGLCLLRHGRAGMATACAPCLDYGAGQTGSQIGAGAAAEQCVLEASWYADPLAGSDAGPAGSGVTGALTAPRGCGCAAGGDASVGLLTLLLAGLSRRSSLVSRSGPTPTFPEQF